MSTPTSIPQSPPMTPESSLPRCVTQRATALKTILICELVLAIWILFFGVGFLPILIIVPTNIVGFYGAKLYRKHLLTAFVLMKTIIVCLASFSFVSLTMSRNSNVVILSMVVLLVIIFQFMCIVMANKIRLAIVHAEHAPNDTELGRVAQSTSQASPQPAHAEMPFPYPPQYPTYMYSPGSQGYPVPVMSYGYVPYGPQGQPQMYPPANGNQGQQPQMAAVYPYMYSEAQPDQTQLQEQQQQQQQPTYAFITPQQNPAEPSQNDTDALLQKNVEN